MGLKYYRASEKPDKVRKRISMSRYWFRDLKWVAYHAHPTMVPGHPFKGGWWLPVGLLDHPDMKRFQIPTHALFRGPTPCHNPYDDCSLRPATPLFSAAQHHIDVSHQGSPACKQALAAVQACEGKGSVGCQYYASLSKRLCK